MKHGLERIDIRYLITGRSEDNLEATSSSSDDTQDMDISGKHPYA